MIPYTTIPQRKGSNWLVAMQWKMDMVPMTLPQTLLSGRQQLIEPAINVS